MAKYYEDIMDEKGYRLRHYFKGNNYAWVNFYDYTMPHRFSTEAEARDWMLRKTREREDLEVVDSYGFPTFTFMDYRFFTCPVCSSSVYEDDRLKHAGWHNEPR